MTFDRARQVADAVLYEGYVLYPYRASSTKNQARFQFGVLVPDGCAASAGESSTMQTECLVERDPGTAALVDVRVRGLHLRRRSLLPPANPPPSDEPPAWDEGFERVMDLSSFEVAQLPPEGRAFPFHFEGGREAEQTGGSDASPRVVREWWPIDARVTIAAMPLGRLVRLRVVVENVTEWNTVGGSPDDRVDREVALRRSLVGVHVFLGVTGGAFVSLLEPPAWAAEAAASCINSGTWPVLVGDPGRRDTLLSSPIILYDYPAVASESPGDFCDGTEIDELLALRVMTLTDDEKREARLTDARAKDIIERTDSLPPEMLERLHGAMRYAGVAAPADPLGQAASPLSDSAKIDADPGGGTIEVSGIPISRGVRVRMRPKRRADSMDLFLAGRAARVRGIYHDTDDRTWIAVTAEDDPAADMHEWYGRYFYFAPDEIEPLTDAETGADAEPGGEPASNDDGGRKAES